MGVINITPNSFSDGGQFNSQETFEKQVQKLASQCHILDIGAESTAPMNKAITYEEEISRFFALDLFTLTKLPIISIDTYRPETFLKLYDYFQAQNYDGELWWNDVSGIFDDSVHEILKLKNTKYIFSHNRVPNREETNQHMNYVNQKDILSEFQESIKQIPQELMPKIILDPCFGFAKSRTQNHQLMDELPKLINKINLPWLIGISRKSFLRFPEGAKLTEPSVMLQAQTLESMYYQYLLQECSQAELILRMHLPELILNSIS